MKKNDKMEKRQKRSVTRYIYSAAGEKLRVTYLTAVPNITVPIGTARELAPSEILAADSTDYLLGGTLTMRNGRIDRYLFEEGYCQAVRSTFNPSQDGFTFYYYDRDHLGSVRQVIEAEGTDQGTIVQKMNYYPSGLQFCNNVTDSDVQTRRYNGKELDRMHGLNTYDYGARQYNPVTARWDRMDPLCEKYYGVSPYAYCAGNPMNFIDPDGKKVYVFATTLPSSYDIIKNSGATHTFTVVKTTDGKVYRFAYGPKADGVINSISGLTPIVECDYQQDEIAVSNFFSSGMDDNTKNVIPVTVPEGMTESEFDNAVINSANEFRGNNTIMYRIIPFGESEGNCNSSTTSLLKNAGIDDKEIERIESMIPGMDIGFGSVKPWTKEQREAAEIRQQEKRKMDESLSNHIGF